MRASSQRFYASALAGALSGIFAAGVVADISFYPRNEALRWGDVANWPESRLPSESDSVSISGFYFPLIVGDAVVELGSDRRIAALDIKTKGGEPITIGTADDVAAGFSLTLLGDLRIDSGPASFNVPLLAGADLTIESNVSGELTLGGGLAEEGGSFSVDFGHASVLGQAAHSGTTFVKQTLRLAGEAGAITKSPLIYVRRDLDLDNSSAVNQNRIADHAAIVLEHKSSLTLRGNGEAAVVEQVGDLRFSGGISDIKLAPGTAGGVTIAATQLVREAGVARVWGLEPDGTAQTGAGAVQVRVAPEMMGNGPAGSASVGVIPYVVSSPSLDPAGMGLTTYDPGPDGRGNTADDRGLRPLNPSTEYAPFGVAAATENARVVADTVINSTRTVQSLQLDDGTRLSGKGDLSVTSGTVLLKNAEIVGLTRLNFGGTEGVVHYSNGSAIEAITGTGGLTLAGEGQISVGAASYTGTTRLTGGRVRLSSISALGDSGGDGVILTDTSLSLPGGGETLKIARPLRVVEPGAYVGRPGPIAGVGTHFTGPVSVEGPLRMGIATLQFDGPVTVMDLLELQGSSASFAGETKVMGVISGDRLSMRFAGATQVQGLLSMYRSQMSMIGPVSGEGTISLWDSSLSSDRAQPFTGTVRLSINSIGFANADDAFGNGSLVWTGSTFRNGDSRPHTYNQRSVEFRENSVIGGLGSSDMTFVVGEQAFLQARIDNNGEQPLTVRLRVPERVPVHVTKSGEGYLALEGIGAEPLGVIVSAGTVSSAFSTPSFNAFITVSGSGRYVWLAEDQVMPFLSGWAVSGQGVLDLNGHRGRAVNLRLGSDEGGGEIATGASGKLVLVRTVMDPSVTVPRSKTTAVISGNLELDAHTTFDVWESADAIDLRVTAAVSGAGSLTKSGFGVLEFTGPASFTGAIRVNAGTFLLNGTSASQSVLVNRLATLGGSGFLEGAVSVSDFGVLSPGNGIGELTMGPLSLAAQARMYFDLAKPDPEIGDMIVVNGDLILDGLLVLGTGMDPGPGRYPLIEYSGVLTDRGLSVEGDLSLPHLIDTSVPGRVSLVVLPEPGAVGCIGVAGALLWRRRRR